MGAFSGQPGVFEKGIVNQAEESGGRAQPKSQSSTKNDTE